MVQQISAANITMFMNLQPVESSGPAVDPAQSESLMNGGADAQLPILQLESGVTWEVPQTSHGRFAIDFAPIFGSLKNVFPGLIISAQSFVSAVLVHGAPFRGSPGVGIFQGYDGFVASLRLHEESVGGRFIQTGEEQFRDQWIAAGSVLSGTRPIDFRGPPQNPRLSLSMAHYNRADRNRLILEPELGAARAISRSSARLQNDLAIQIKSILERRAI